MLPPKVEVHLEEKDRLANGTLDCEVTLTRVTELHAHVPGATRSTHARLVGGCTNNDKLLLNRTLVLETFQSPLKVGGLIIGEECGTATCCQHQDT